MLICAWPKRTVGVQPQFEHVANADIDDAEEALILLLELALVKDLDSEDAVFGDPATMCQLYAQSLEARNRIRTVVPG